MKLRELELEQKSCLAGTGIDSAYTVEVPRDMEAMLNSDVMAVTIPLRCDGLQVDLDLWLVQGSKAMLLTGPTPWLKGRTRWFCVDDEALCVLLIYKMEEHWGEDETGKHPEALDEMCARIEAYRAPCVALCRVDL